MERACWTLPSYGGLKVWKIEEVSTRMENVAKGQGLLSACSKWATVQISSRSFHFWHPRSRDRVLGKFRQLPRHSWSTTFSKTGHHWDRHQLPVLERCPAYRELRYSKMTENGTQGPTLSINQTAKTDYAYPLPILFILWPTTPLLVSYRTNPVQRKENSLVSFSLINNYCH